MMDMMLVEEILRQLAFARKQGELVLRRKSERGTEALAARAVADNSVVKIGINLEADRTALATSMIMSGRHLRVSP